MKKLLITLLGILLFAILVFSLRLDIIVAERLFTTCNEYSGWESVPRKQCSCKGIEYDVTPNTHDYGKSVCIGLIKQ